MNYVAATRAALARHLPGLEPELLDLYTLLTLICGDQVTDAHVHDAWAVWRNRTQPDHRSILPFTQLARVVQEKDRPYADAIRATAQEPPA